MYKTIFLLIGLLVGSLKLSSQITIKAIDSVLLYCPDKPLSIDFYLTNHSKEKKTLYPYFSDVGIADSIGRPLNPTRKSQYDTETSKVQINPNDKMKITVPLESIGNVDLGYNNKYFVSVSLKIKIKSKKYFFSFPLIVNCQ